MRNYKQIKCQGVTYQSTYPAGKSQKIKLKKGEEIEFWGLPPEEYKAMQNAQQKKAKVIGFVNFSSIPTNPVNTLIFDINGIKSGFPITAKPKSDVVIYLNVGNNKFVGLEEPTLKESLKTIKEIKSKEKARKKKEKLANKKAKHRKK